MKKIYEKSEIWFAVMWIIIYVVVMGNLRSNFGDESLYFMLGMLIIATILTVFIVKNRLTFSEAWDNTMRHEEDGSDLSEMRTSYPALAE